MSPQPLSSINPTLNARWDPKAFSKRPTLAAMIMEVITIWSHVDVKLAAIMGNLMAAHITTATALFQALGSDAKTTALLAAAQEAMAPEVFELFAATLSSTRAARDRRNAFAHHVWGICDALGDALILVDPKTLANQWAAMMDSAISGRPFAWKTPEFPLDNSRWFVYRESDLRDSIAASERAFKIAVTLAHMTAPQLPQHIFDSKCAELLADPLIQSALERRSRKN